MTSIAPVARPSVHAIPSIGDGGCYIPDGPAVCRMPFPPAEAPATTSTQAGAGHAELTPAPFDPTNPSGCWDARPTTSGQTPPWLPEPDAGTTPPAHHPGDTPPWLPESAPVAARAFGLPPFIVPTFPESL